MKNVTISLNKSEYEVFQRKAKDIELSEYALAKRILLEYLNGGVSNSLDDAARPYANKVKTLKNQQKWAYAIIFGLACYFLVSIVYILFF